MIKIRSRRAALSVGCALLAAPLFASAQPKSGVIAIDASAYRSKLQKTLAALKTARPAAVGKIIKPLDTKFAVRRADGQIQSVSGNFWSNFSRTVSAPSSATPTQKRRAEQELVFQIRALDEWLQTPVYQSIDARKIVLGLEASGQIRTGPLWWQKAISDAWSAVAKVWNNFWNWLRGLLPTPKPLNTTKAPSDKWLWGLFYVVVATILGLMLWFAFRAFGGNLGRRKVKSASELAGEDAELLQLPPEELLSRAERFAAQGNFREALRHRFLSLLLDLDARGVWRYDARRTNWEHIALLSRAERGRELVAPLSDLTRRFDRVRYGGAICDAQGWQNFDGDARTFEALPAVRQNPSAVRETEMAR